MKKANAYDKAEMSAIRKEYFKGIVLGGLVGILLVHLVLFFYGVIWMVVLAFKESDFVGWGTIFELPYILIIGLITAPFGYGLYKVLDQMGFSPEAVIGSVYAFYAVVILRVIISIVLQYA